MRMMKMLAEHMRWADHLILEALRGENVPARALELYAHVLGAEHVWLARLQGRAPELEVWPALGVDDCARVASLNASALAAFLEDTPEDHLPRPVRYRNSAGREFESRMEDILLQVAMHGQYHRGQVNLLLRDAGLQPAPVDYIAFVRGVPAATRPDDAPGRSL